tara:strand:+ start:1082 stop:2170 length:1089 start_codon:yes stop_codon:yes gene_type:complete
MAVEVHVQNFQSLKNTGLEISGFTAITGPNNSGKTALMRAIRGVFQNSPGTSFVSHGADEMKVSLKFDDGRSVVWTKGTTKRHKPTYIVDGGKPIHPGRAVPDEVRALGVTPIRIMGQEIWPTLAPQFSGQVFLLDQPGSALAEAVADVERVARLNGALRSSDRDLRATASRLKVRREDRLGLIDDLQGFDGLDTVVAQVEAVELDLTKAAKFNRAIETMTSYRARLTNATAEVERLGRIEDVNIPEASEAQEALGELVAASRLRDRLAESKLEVARLEGIEHVTVEDIDTKKVAAALAALEFFQGVRVRLTAAQSRVSELEEEFESFSAEAERVGGEVKELLGAFEECPTCGSPMEGHEHD